MKLPKLTSLVLTLALSAVGFAQDPMQPATPAAPQADAPKEVTYTFKRVAVKGQTLKYKLAANLEAADTKIQYTTTLTESVEEVKPNGDYVTKSQQSETMAKIGDKDDPAPTPPDPGSIETYNALGDVIDLKSQAGVPGAADWRVANLNVIHAPDQAMKVGDAWTYKIKGNPKGAVDATAEYKVLGVEKVGDKDTVKVSVKIKETMGMSPAASEGTYWLDAKDFSMVKCDTSWTNVPVPGDSTLVSGKITIALAG